MTVSNTNNKDIYSIDSSSSSFSFSYTFDITQPEDITVELYDVDGDVVNTLTYVSDTPDAANEFTVNTSAETVTLYDGGEATFQDEYGTDVSALVISRSVDVTQEIELVTNRALQATTVEDIVDKLTMICQELSEAQNRMVRFPITETSSSVTLPSSSARASGYLAFDESGNIIVTSDILTVPDTITVSSFMETVLDDTTANAARTTLGLGDVATLDIDTDGGMTANSDSKIPTQQAVVEYVANETLSFTSLNPSTNVITDEDNTGSLWVAGNWTDIDIGPDGLDLVPAGTKAIAVFSELNDDVVNSVVKIGAGGYNNSQVKLRSLISGRTSTMSGVVGITQEDTSLNICIYVSTSGITFFNIGVSGYWS